MPGPQVAYLLLWFPEPSQNNARLKAQFEGAVRGTTPAR